MLIKLYFDHTQSETSGDGTHPLSRRSRIIAGTCRQYHWEGSNLLSLSSFIDGQALFKIGEGRYAVDDNSYIIVNQGQRLSFTIESKTEVQSLYILFGSHLAAEVYRSLTASAERLLGEPEGGAATPFEFVEKTYLHDDIVSPALFCLRALLRERKDDDLWIGEQLRDLMQRMFHVNGQVRREIESLSALRSSTREELYRRLYRARDYMAASFDRQVTLEEMARVACLSSNHFLRTFKQVFRQTPHQYLTSLRLQHARKLLAETDLPVTQVCHSVGFTSLGSFSRLFRRHTGVSPEVFRIAKR